MASGASTIHVYLRAPIMSKFSGGRGGWGVGGGGMPQTPPPIWYPVPDQTNRAKVIIGASPNCRFINNTPPAFCTCNYGWMENSNLVGCGLDSYEKPSILMFSEWLARSVSAAISWHTYSSAWSCAWGSKYAPPPLHSFRAKWGSLLGLSRDRMASMATFRMPSKVSFWFATVNQAPSPALRILNMVSYIHEEPW